MHYAVYMRSIYVCVEYILQRIRFGYPTDPDILDLIMKCSNGCSCVG